MSNTVSEMDVVEHGFTLNELVQDGRVNVQEIAELRQRCAVLDVPLLTDEQLALFLLSCDHDIDFTVNTVIEYHKAKKNAPELFDNRNLERDDLQYQLNVIEYSIFPRRTPDGCAILFHRLHDTSFSHYNMEHSMKLLFMTLDAAIYDSPPTGLIILFDMKGVGLLHLTRVKLGAVRKFCHYLQEGLPVKLRRIHVLNTAYFIDKVMSIVKPFLRKELLEQLHFHSVNMNMDDFNKNFLPKGCLPEDFGGELPNTRQLHEENTEKLEEMRPYFDAEQQQRHKHYLK